MRKLFIDFETRSKAELKNVGAFKYCQDPSTEITLVAWAFDDDPVQVRRWANKENISCVPIDVIMALDDQTVLKIAHNAEFDMCVVKYCTCCTVFTKQWHDTAFQAAYYGYPRSLANLAGYLNTKQKASQEELRLFSTPVKAAKKKQQELFSTGETQYNDESTHPEEWKRFVEYARGDVEVMRECYKKMAALPSIEIDVMHRTFEMNFEGVPFDIDLAERIMTKVKGYENKAADTALSKYGIANLRSVQQVKAALARHGVYLDSLNTKMRGDANHEILELRDQATGAAFRKLPTAYSRVCEDGRLHGEFKGNGAHTGRWSSQGTQLQNWSRILDPDKVNESLEHVDSYDLLRQHLRLCLGHEKGMAFVCADLSQIEARIIAWLARCTWRMDAFADGVDIYSRSAEKMFRKPVTKKDIERQYGKAAELGFGFGGSGKAIERINPKFYAEVGAAFAQDLCQQWRRANPEIVDLWHRLYRGFEKAFRCGSDTVIAGGVPIKMMFDGHTMRVTLPSGRALWYRSLSATPSQYGFDLQYCDYKEGHAVTTKIWYGTLVENIVQAIARDILVDIMTRIKIAMPTAELIGTVHDEIWYLVPEIEGDAALRKVLSTMSDPIVWAPGLLTKGDGFKSDRYRK